MSASGHALTKGALAIAYDEEAGDLFLRIEVDGLGELRVPMSEATAEELARGLKRAATYARGKRAAR